MVALMYGEKLTEVTISSADFKDTLEMLLTLHYTMTPEATMSLPQPQPLDRC